jgi:hypothetical protein
MPSKLALLVAPVVLSLGAALSAQCAVSTSSNVPQPHLSGIGFCSTVWDPDGAGPLPQRLVVGGGKLLGGAQLLGGSVPSLQCVMTWDGSTFEPLGTLADDAFDSVSELFSWNGQLIAGGNFTNLNGPSHVARWDGASWQPLGSGFPVSVTALTVWNGNLAVAGWSYVGAATTPVVKTWDGTTWTTLPVPPMLRAPAAMVSYQGELVIAGSAAALPPTQGVLERWNGTSWATSIVAQNSILSLSVRTSLQVGVPDTLFVAGSFTSIGGTAVAKIAKTNGGATFAWSSVGSGLTSTVQSLHVRNTVFDYVVVAIHGNTPLRYTSSNNTWNPMGTAPMNAVAYYAGSYHGVDSSVGLPACQRYDGSQWVPVNGPGIVGEVRAAVRSGNDMVIGGTFATISGAARNCIARWTGSTFAPLGTGMVGSSVDALVTLDNGDIVAGGNFVAAGGVAANHVARWNGTSWSAMGNGFDAPVRALCKMPNGDVIAGGAFTQEVGAPVLCSHVARWNGSSWSPMHFGMNDDVLALVVRGDGTLFAGGRFTQTMVTMFSIYHVARWTGTQWAGLGAGMNAPVHGLAARPNGDVVAVGEFTQASLQNVDRIARWNGSSWVSMGASSGNPGIVHAVYALPNGDVIAGRGFYQPLPSVDAGLSRWNGATWSSLAFLAAPESSASVDVRTIGQRADGALVIGGNFAVAATTISHAIATLQSDCMATATNYGAGCSSAAGPITITADTLPWIGAPFATTTTGIAANSLCLGLIGLSQLSLPLDLLLAEGQPGCSLLTVPDIQMLLLPDAGAAHSSFPLGSDPTLIGVVFFQQTIPFEFDAFGAIAAIRGSNALSLVIGTL